MSMKHLHTLDLCSQTRFNLAEHLVTAMSRSLREPKKRIYHYQEIERLPETDLTWSGKEGMLIDAWSQFGM